MHNCFRCSRAHWCRLPPWFAKASSTGIQTRTRPQRWTTVKSTLAVPLMRNAGVNAGIATHPIMPDPKSMRREGGHRRKNGSIIGLFYGTSIQKDLRTDSACWSPYTLLTLTPISPASTIIPVVQAQRGPQSLKQHLHPEKYVSSADIGLLPRPSDSQLVAFSATLTKMPTIQIRMAMYLRN